MSFHRARLNQFIINMLLAFGKNELKIFLCNFVDSNKDTNQLHIFFEMLVDQDNVNNGDKAYTKHNVIRELWNFSDHNKKEFMKWILWNLAIKEKIQALKMWHYLTGSTLEDSLKYHINPLANDCENFNISDCECLSSTHYGDCSEQRYVLKIQEALANINGNTKLMLSAKVIREIFREADSYLFQQKEDTK